MAIEANANRILDKADRGYADFAAAARERAAKVAAQPRVTVPLPVTLLVTCGLPL